ncbi:MAG: hypothetical protein QFB86_00470 [Patescibacteria group bacterium]|nr:hypothetical protein [Patescibacteria group bacterium]
MPKHKKLAKHRRKKPEPVIDRLVYLAAIATPIMTIPQFYTVWFEHKQGSSFSTWAAYSVIALVWLIYALKHKDKPLILVEISGVILYTSIAVGLFINKAS